jgi:hypothetical protein
MATCRFYVSMKDSFSFWGFAPEHHQAVADEIPEKR